MVEAGELPPVAERLPVEPYVSTATEIGQYGGTFRGAGFGPTHGQLDTEGMRFVGLLRVLPDNVTTEPFILKSYDVNAALKAPTPSAHRASARPCSICLSCTPSWASASFRSRAAATWTCASSRT